MNRNTAGNNSQIFNYNRCASRFDSSNTLDNNEEQHAEDDNEATEKTVAATKRKNMEKHNSAIICTCHLPSSPTAHVRESSSVYILRSGSIN